MKKQRIELRVSTLEKEIIKKKAENSGLSVSEYLVRAALNEKISYKLTTDELEAYKGLHEIRRNFTLISNMFKIKDPELAKKVEETATEVKEHLKKFKS